MFDIIDAQCNHEVGFYPISLRRTNHQQCFVISLEIKLNKLLEVSWAVIINVMVL